MSNILKLNNIDLAVIDESFYLDRHRDVRVAGMPPKEHYRLYGAKEGRISHINQEFDIIRDKINSLNLSILELGPFDNPRFSGHNVKYMDVLNQAELEDRKKKYKRKKKVPIIDYVCRDGRLGSINEKFDIVFSAHCIEHNISLIDHL